MKSTSALDFGLFIAYLVPGFVGFYAFTYISPEARAVFNLSLESSSGVSAELGIGLFSIAAGIIISALRDLVLDNIQFRTGVEKPNLNWSNLSDEGVNNAFKGAVDNTYRFAQFCGNMFVATFLLVVFRIFIADLGTTVVLIVCVIFLFFAHRSQLRESYRTMSEILQGEGRGTNGKSEESSAEDGSKEGGD